MRYITTPEAEKAALKAISEFQTLAVDTEADSLHRYFEKLCLVQVSTPKEDYVFDPLAPLDLSSLAALLEKKELIFHGADFDVRILRRFFNFSPRKIVDTMLAAQFLSYPSPSLQTLANKFCQVHLSKSNQKADWSKRPLTSSMITYAANDTHYLYRIWETLSQELKKMNRMKWFEESCEGLLETTKITRTVDPDKQWKVKGSSNLSDRELVLLKELWRWRDEEARRRDRPPFKVLQSEGLITVVKWKTAHPDQPLNKMQRLPPQLKSSFFPGIEEALKRARALPDHSHKAKKEVQKKKPRADKKILGELKSMRNQIAKDQKCEPSLLVSNGVMEKIAVSHPRQPQELKKLGFLRNWQFQILSEPFLKILNGKRIHKTP
jgi:ribonuclease D